MIGLGVIPSHWTRRGLRARTAWGSWFYWRPRSHGPRLRLPTLSKRTTVPFDRSWQVKPTRMWCVNSVLILPPRQNSPEACVSDQITWAENRRFCCSVTGPQRPTYLGHLSHFSQCFFQISNLVFQTFFFSKINLVYFFCVCDYVCCLCSLQWVCDCMCFIWA